jgi:ribonuclease P protein component
LPDERLPRCRILKDPNRIRDLLQHGRRRRGRILTVYLSPSERPRAAFLVPRRYGDAVLRNLQKRRLREWFRLHQSRFPAGRDLLFLLRAKDRKAPAGTEQVVASWQELQSDLDALFPAAPLGTGADPLLPATPVAP